MNAKEFLETKGIFSLETKKRYNEVIEWMEEYALSKNLLSLRQARKCLGLSQKELAEKTGLTHVQLSNLENGKSMPRLSTMRRIEEALKCEVAWEITH